MPYVTTDAHVRPLPPGLRDARHLVGKYRIRLPQLRGPLARCGECRIVEPSRREHLEERLHKLLAPRLELLLKLIAGDVIPAAHSSLLRDKGALHDSVDGEPPRPRA